VSENIYTEKLIFKEMYRHYQIFLSLLKMDVFATFMALAMGVFFVKFDWWWSYVGFGIGFAVTVFAAPAVVYLGVWR